MVHLVETCLRHHSSGQAWSRNGRSSRAHQEPGRRLNRSTPPQHCMGRLSLLQPPLRVDLPTMFRGQYLQPLPRVDLPTMPRGQRLQPPPRGKPVKLLHKLTMEDVRPGNTRMSMEHSSRGSTCQLVWPLLVATITIRLGPPGWLVVLPERLRLLEPQ
jgi:hypothetical protein